MYITTTLKAINSKSLYVEIDEIITDGIFAVELDWQDDNDRGIFIEFINSMLHEFWDRGDIEQWKIQCNTLNNTIEEMMNGKFNLDIYYKQRHCLNTSKITYTIIE